MLVELLFDIALECCLCSVFFCESTFNYMFGFFFMVGQAKIVTFVLLI